MKILDAMVDVIGNGSWGVVGGGWEVVMCTSAVGACRSVAKVREVGHFHSDCKRNEAVYE